MISKLILTIVKINLLRKYPIIIQIGLFLLLKIKVR